MYRGDCFLSGTNQRENWIDFAKAIGIILVIYAHALPKDNYIWIWINSFHMPLFFCISGYLYSCKGGFLPYVAKKVRTLWVPFEVASFATYIVFLLIGQSTFTIKEVAKISGGDTVGGNTRSHTEHDG